MFYNLWNKGFIFFLGVLAVEDAVRFVLESDTAETVLDITIISTV
jgi:hypothetical protein